MQVRNTCSVRVDPKNRSVTVGATGEAGSVKGIADQQQRRGRAGAAAVGELPRCPTVSGRRKRINHGKLRGLGGRRRETQRGCR